MQTHLYKELGNRDFSIRGNNNHNNNNNNNNNEPGNGDSSSRGLVENIDELSALAQLGKQQIFGLAVIRLLFTDRSRGNKLDDVPMTRKTLQKLDFLMGDVKVSHLIGY